jgi:hypothetical protein
VAVRLAVGAAPAVESRFEAVVGAAGVVRVAAVLEAAVPAVVLVLEAALTGARVVVVLVAGLRAAAAEELAVVDFFSSVLPGLDMRVLVRRDAVDDTDFFSSSLALTLGRLR